MSPAMPTMLALLVLVGGDVGTGGEGSCSDSQADLENFKSTFPAEPVSPPTFNDTAAWEQYIMESTRFWAEKKSLWDSKKTACDSGPLKLGAKSAVSPDFASSDDTVLLQVRSQAASKATFDADASGATKEMSNWTSMDGDLYVHPAVADDSPFLAPDVESERDGSHPERDVEETARHKIGISKGVHEVEPPNLFDEQWLKTVAEKASANAKVAAEAAAMAATEVKEKLQESALQKKLQQHQQNQKLHESALQQKLQELEHLSVAAPPASMSTSSISHATTSHTDESTMDFDRDLVPIYEYYKPGLTTSSSGVYLYTPSGTPKFGWENKTVAFYAYTGPSAGAVQVLEYYDETTGNRVYKADGNEYGIPSRVAFYALRSPTAKSIQIYENFHADSNSYRYSATDRHDNGWAPVDGAGFYAYWPQAQPVSLASIPAALEPNWAMPPSPQQAVAPAPAPPPRPAVDLAGLVPIYEYFKPWPSDASAGWYLYTPSGTPKDGWGSSKVSFLCVLDADSGHCTRHGVLRHCDGESSLPS
eukprot:gnl/TRDRNA2_/TRDRNA2_175473_c0_seq2.p1 gnl/TRDRNA2_/TRDRNA2_175473_c0~~gnl/TRDRNA2_/TRDRNA2_175473_c0_seq2.p1  ORF type:complete len:534 (+),score=61.78 gnl/TRDRNA2_/TRDRNA2_175473_c0_seq2:105-1706(+)